jgi:hypothetical protein
VVLRRDGVYRLGPDDVEAATGLIAGGDPQVDVFVDYRIRTTRMDIHALGGEIWGYFAEGRLLSLCHSGANLVVAHAVPGAVDAFARHALRRGRRCATIIGLREDVRGLWDVVGPTWGPAREERWDQPHMVIEGPPTVEPDPLVRRATMDDLPVVHPAAVAMYTEEVGISPNIGGGGEFYRSRVGHLIGAGWSFVRIDDGRVVFKAEVSAASPYACQVQGVYVDPERRGEGLAAPGMAAVVAFALRDIAPSVTLYANAHNVPAIHCYERAGFRQTATFASVMF